MSIRLLLFVLAASCAVTEPAVAFDESWLQTYMDARGGCRPNWQSIEFASSKLNHRIRYDGDNEEFMRQDLFGKKLSDWTQDDVETAMQFYIKCNQEVYNVTTDPPYAISVRRDLTELVAEIEKVRGNKQRQLAAQAQLQREQAVADAAEDKRKQAEAEIAEAAERAQASALVQNATSQADADTRAAEEMERQLAMEAKQLAEAQELASSAAERRRSAEQRLLEVRQKRRVLEETLAPAATVPALASNPSCEVSAVQYTKLRLGMSYEQVRRIIGCDGSEIVSSKLGPVQTTRYLWGNAETAGIDVMFQNRRLMQKAQIGLQ